MSEAVVDGLEVVEVDEEACNWAGERTQPLDEEFAVGQTRQPIVDGAMRMQIRELAEQPRHRYRRDCTLRAEHDEIVVAIAMPAGKNSSPRHP